MARGPRGRMVRMKWDEEGESSGDRVLWLWTNLRTANYIPTLCPDAVVVDSRVHATLVRALTRP